MWVLLRVVITHNVGANNPRPRNDDVRNHKQKTFMVMLRMMA